MIVAFTHDLDWDSFLNAAHSDDIELLRQFSEYADQAMDIIKLHFCTLSVPDAMPGRVGTWGESGECLCALLYHLQDNESYLVAGRGVVSRVVAGMGLELNPAQCACPMSLPGVGEVGGIARHGLRLIARIARFQQPCHWSNWLFALFSFMFGMSGTTVIGAWLDTFVLTWPAALYTIFRVTTAVGARARQGTRRSRVLARAALLLFLVACDGYFQLCLAVGYPIAQGCRTTNP